MWREWTGFDKRLRYQEVVSLFCCGVVDVMEKVLAGQKSITGDAVRCDAMRWKGGGRKRNLANTWVKVPYLFE